MFREAARTAEVHWSILLRVMLACLVVYLVQVACLEVAEDIQKLNRGKTARNGHQELSMTKLANRNRTVH